MKSLWIILYLVCYSLFLHAQIKYEKGYYIDNTFTLVNCLIKNNDWRDCPKEINYKTDLNERPVLIDISNLLEFGIGSEIKYIKLKVLVDNSGYIESTNLSKKTDDLLESEVFVKLLIKGKATLYQYTKGYIFQYLYQLENSPIELLKYGIYSVKGREYIDEEFLKQLSGKINCECIKQKDIHKLNYYKSDLMNHFTAYNKCFNSNYINPIVEPQRDVFSFKLKGSIMYTTLSILYLPNQSNTVFFPKIGYMWGAEGELFLPFNRNKWSFIFEPTIQTYKSGYKTRESNLFPLNIKYTSIELPIGFRYYMLLKNDFKLFANSSLIIDWSYNSMLFADIFSDKELSSKLSFSVGAGVQYLRFSGEARYYTPRELLGNQLSWSTNYQKFAITIGYELFKIKSKQRNL